jgi:hypothetical protein
MELLEYNFSKLTGNLYYDEVNNTYEMFSNVGKPMHLNYLTFKELVKNMDNKELNIIETGISCYGTNSTYFFNDYIRKYGGRLWSVDINPYLVNVHSGNMCPATQLICNDSVTFIKEWVSNNPNEKIDVVYLDSYDLDFYNPKPSAIHGLNEYLEILPALQKDSLLLIDDTPINPYWLDNREKIYEDMLVYYETNNELPGKGMYVVNINNTATKLMHNYQVLYKF